MTTTSPTNALHANVEEKKMDTGLMTVASDVNNRERGKKTATRSEGDSLGSVEVPATALYGAQTVRAINNYPISGRTAHPALIRAYLRLKSAAAAANGKLGVLHQRGGSASATTPPSDQDKEVVATLIHEAVEELMRPPLLSSWSEIFPVDPYQAGAGTSQNMNVNEVVANVANRKVGKPLGSYVPVHPNDHVNRSQSSNDSFPTAMRLAILELGGEFSQALWALSRAFHEKGEEWRTVPKAGRTHLQDAVPMTLGQEFEAYAATLAQCARWIDEGREHLRELGIGGGAAGTGLTVPPGFASYVVVELSRLTGEELRLAPNLCAATQSQLPVSFYSSMMRLCALELTRICNDLRLLASGPMTGLAEIILPSVQPGSSIMPGKINPSIIEMANQTWFSVIGYDQTVAGCIQAGQLELNVMMPMMAYSTLEATQVATRAVEVLRRRCVEGLQPNLPNLRRYFETTPQIATALSPTLGYARTASLVKEALEKGISVIELVRGLRLIPEEELERLLDVKQLTGVAGD